MGKEKRVQVFKFFRVPEPILIPDLEGNRSQSQVWHDHPAVSGGEGRGEGEGVREVEEILTGMGWSEKPGFRRVTSSRSLTEGHCLTAWPLAWRDERKGETCICYIQEDDGCYCVWGKGREWWGSGGKVFQCIPDPALAAWRWMMVRGRC